MCRNIAAGCSYIFAPPPLHGDDVLYILAEEAVAQRRRTRMGLGCGEFTVVVYTTDFLCVREFIEGARNNITGRFLLLPETGLDGMYVVKSSQGSLSFSVSKRLPETALRGLP